MQSSLSYHFRHGQAHDYWGNKHVENKEVVEPSSVFARHLEFNEKDKAGTNKLSDAIEHQRMMDNRSTNAKIYDDALVPKLPKYRIPERETITARLTKDAATWALQKEHKRDLYDAIVPRN